MTISKEVQATSPPTETLRSFSVSSSSGSQSPSLQRSIGGLSGSVNGSTAAVKKPISLIDRFHDKLFVKKSSNIKASASISPQTPESAK